MKVNLPQYSSKDFLVLPLVLLPFTMVINYAIFDIHYFEVKVFLVSTLITGIVFGSYFVLCSALAVMMRNRLPKESQTGIRLLIIISNFLIMTGVILALLFWGYAGLPFVNQDFSQGRFVWAYVGLGIINIFLTFLFEGISRFDQWKINLQETEQLQKTYRRSQLAGLRDQVNPHFLFNSLNSLSSLIAEEGDEAEEFLDEMSKVYRYILRNDIDQFVTLRTEVQFLKSYLHLLKVRFGRGFQVNFDVDEMSLDRYLPPLTLQSLIEIAFEQNTLSKTKPLIIEIFSHDQQTLCIRNNIQVKEVTNNYNDKARLEDLVKKYALMDHAEVLINQTQSHHTISIPLLKSSDGVPV